MNRKRCIFRASEKQGMQIFWFEPCQSDDAVFNAEYVKVFGADDDEPFVRLHKSKILELDDDVETQTKWGRLFPTDDWMEKLQWEWVEPG